MFFCLVVSVDVCLVISSSVLMFVCLVVTVDVSLFGGHC